MPAPDPILRPGIVGATAAAASLLAVARTPAAGAEAMAYRVTPKPASPSGWLAFRRPDATWWYVQIRYDSHGFEQDGRSGSTPPADVDPADIPRVEPPDGAPIVASHLAHVLRQTRAARAGERFGLLGTMGDGVAPDMRLAALYRLERARAIAGTGQAAEYVDSFISALETCSPGAGAAPDPVAIRDLAGHFARDIERERAELTIDAPSAGFVELLCSAIAAANDVGVRFLASGVQMWLPMVPGNDSLALFQHVAMLCRKWDVGFLERCAQAARDRAERCVDMALGAVTANDYAGAIGAACHAAWLADALFKHIAAHAHAVPGLQTSPIFAKLANNAEEFLVRTNRAAMNWHSCFYDGAFANHRLNVIRRMRAGGQSSGENWATELVENYFYYPRALRPILAAADPGGPIETDPVPIIALDAHAAFLRTLGLSG